MGRTVGDYEPLAMSATGGSRSLRQGTETVLIERGEASRSMMSREVGLLLRGIRR